MPILVRIQSYHACKSVSACRGDGQYLDAGVHRSREAQTRFKIKVYVGNKIDLVDEDEPGRGEHVRVLERLVLTLGHRDHDDFAVLTEIEERRAHQIADVFDEQQGFRLRIQGVKCAVNHVGVEVAAGAGVDLHRAGARRPNSLGVEQCLLITLDDGDRAVASELSDGAFEKCCLPRARVNWSR